MVARWFSVSNDVNHQRLQVRSLCSSLFFQFCKCFLGVKISYLLFFFTSKAIKGEDGGEMASLG